MMRNSQTCNWRTSETKATFKTSDVWANIDSAKKAPRAPRRRARPPIDFGVLGQNFVERQIGTSPSASRYFGASGVVTDDCEVSVGLLRV